MISENYVNDKDLPTVLVGTVVQNKAWAILPHLESILAQDYPREKISLTYYVNDSTDGTKEKLVERLQKIKQEGVYRRIKVVEVNYGYKDLRRTRPNLNVVLARENDPERAVARFAHFARVRNAWLKLREDEEYYFSVDSDVILKQPFALRQLVGRGKDIVAAPVSNSENRADNYDPAKEVWARLLKDPDAKMRGFVAAVQRGQLKGGRIGPKAVYNFGMLRGGRMQRFYPMPGLFKVDITGACILFHKRVVERGVEYGPNFMGEDVFFCALARTLGFDIFVDGKIETLHAMDHLPKEYKA